MTIAGVGYGTALGVLLALLGQVVLNRRAIPRLGAMPSPAAPPPRVAVLVPARDEAAGTAASVRAWARQRYAPYEVVVLDDDSRDATAEVAERAAAGFGHVRVVRGRGLEPGWRGKPWACHRLRRHVSAEVLVFADADVRPGPDALARLVAALDALPADLVSVLPAAVQAPRAVQALAALQHWAAFALVPAWAGALRRSPTCSAANGQLLAVRAAVYDAVGGFAAVRGTLAEDAALGRRVAQEGGRVRLVDGGGLVQCAPHRDVAALWRANVRNLHAVLFGSTGLALLAAGGLLALFVAPPVALALALASGHARAAVLPLAAVTVAVATRAIVDRRAGYPWGLCLSHPAAAGLLAAMIAESALRARLGRDVEWRGRRYPVRDEAAESRSGGP